MPANTREYPRIPTNTQEKSARIPREYPSSRAVSSFSFGSRLDAAGPAAVFRANAVAGRDLLAFSCVSEVVADLRMTPFAARKVLELRDA